MNHAQQSDAPASAGPVKYRGQVVYIYGYDIAYDMSDQPVNSLLGQPLYRYYAGSDKRSPRELFFYRPEMVRLPTVRRTTPHGPVDVQFSVKVFRVGAISISVRVPFEVSSGDELVQYHDLRFSEGSLHEEVQQLAQQVLAELAPYCIRPVSQIKDEEAYTVFCIEAPLLNDAGRPLAGERWLEANRSQIAALLTQEPDAASLSMQEAMESTGRYLSYYEGDLSVVDWDAALLVDQPENFDDILHVAELANVQLAELEAYDVLLDDALPRAYRDLRKRRLFRGTDILRSLREIRIDLARLSDETSNITKFFGDWHLARIYKQLSSRFHIDSWRRVIDEKLKTLDGLYQLQRQDQMNWWMMILEATIVLLFIIDLIVLVMLPLGH